MFVRDLEYALWSFTTTIVSGVWYIDRPQLFQGSGISMQAGMDTHVRATSRRMLLLSALLSIFANKQDNCHNLCGCLFLRDLLTVVYPTMTPLHFLLPGQPSPLHLVCQKLKPPKVFFRSLSLITLTPSHHLSNTLFPVLINFEKPCLFNLLSYDRVFLLVIGLVCLLPPDVHVIAVSLINDCSKLLAPLSSAVVLWVCL